MSEKNDKKVKVDLWLQGYMCAIANIIQMNGIVETDIKEAFYAAIGDTGVQDLRDKGVDEQDLLVFRAYQNQLKLKD